jgi:hypothetical protein
MSNLPDDNVLKNRSKLRISKEWAIMSNGLGLFNWIRDGVKQSVLLGVSEAIDTLGAPDETRALNPALLSFAKQPVTTQSNARIEEPAQRKTPAATGRKRLGRSLRDIDPKPAS